MVSPQPVQCGKTGQHPFVQWGGKDECREWLKASKIRLQIQILWKHLSLSHISHLNTYPFYCSKVLERSESCLATQIYFTSRKKIKHRYKRNHKDRHIMDIRDSFTKILEKVSFQKEILQLVFLATFPAPRMLQLLMLQNWKDCSLFYRKSS